MARRRLIRRQKNQPTRPPARLVRFEEKRRIATRNLGASELRIGRDPTCDWIVDYANVSRHHAVVRPQGDRNVVQDLGSTNGVLVNHEPLGGKPHVLSPGDVIQLTESVVLLYEEGPFASSTPWIVTAVAMILLLIASIGLYLTSKAQAASQASGGGGPESAVVGTHSEMDRSGLPQAPGLEGARAPSGAHRPAPDVAAPPRDWRDMARMQSSGDPRRETRREGDPL